MAEKTRVQKIESSLHIVAQVLMLMQEIMGEETERSRVC